MIRDSLAAGLIISISLFFSLFPLTVFAGEFPDRISITYVAFPLNAPLIVARAQGMFEKEFGPDGISVAWPELTSGPTQAEALASGAVQFASVISADAVLRARSKGQDIVAIGVFARAPRAYSIMVMNPAIRSIADLRGKAIAGPKGTRLHLLLVSALQRAGLQASAVRFVNVQAGQALRTLLSGSVDAALIAGPDRIKGELEGARVLITGEGLSTGLILTAANESFLRAHPDLGRRYLAVHARALQFMTENRERTLALLARETGIGVDDVKRLLPDYDFQSSVTEEDYHSLSLIQDFLLEQGLVTQRIDVKGLFWP